MRLGCVQAGKRGVTRNHDVRVIAKPLHAAVPNIAMNVVVYARWHSQKLEMPQCRKSETEDEDALRKFWRGEEFADGQEVRNASNSQGNKKGRFASAAEVA